MKLSGKKIIVVGLARSGASIARFLSERGAHVVISDAKAREALGELPAAMEQEGIELDLSGHTQHLFENADLVVLSPGVPHTLAPVKRARELGVSVVGEIELASRFIEAPILAVTGTNGKTTTTALLGEMLAASGMKVFTGGNIGTPLTECLRAEDPADVVVVEVSSFQLDTIEHFRPHVAVLLNITDDHLDRYPDFDAYKRSKGRIFENQGQDDVAILNTSDPHVADIGRVLRNRKLTIGGSGPNAAAVTRTQVTIRTSGLPEVRIDLTKSLLVGAHNRQNIATAALAALSAGATAEGIQDAVDHFKGLPHRIEYVDTVSGITFYNDSKATNIDAVEKAVTGFDTPIVLIMGGRYKGGRFASLSKALKKKARAIIAIGEAKKKIVSALAPSIKTLEAEDLDDAVNKAFSKAKAGDSVVLSPACSSFDMFTNYNERGEKFRESVYRLKAHHG
ncbi:UDP-N-acetylmuramoyl-L-alanine--D-glutamate ligase [Desulfoluna sp.]|uniref:UDP-N-acetylmuramoyl-L-alanine--D-glutamate ligase n=1 Tax=Desulfoluna sp. TaxID=2045199 RepID=UPI00262CB11E|nr:UDP-N-acetylmuramoyl-L-alanine--D-glutamate ligase [Desulfoluna sp.]